MVKIRRKSVYNDLKTGLISKICLGLGIILLGAYVFLKSISLVVQSGNTGLEMLSTLGNSSLNGMILAFSILFIGAGLLFYFLHYQFQKLAEIADENKYRENR